MLTQICMGLRFYSRLPIPTGPWERDPHGVPDFRRITPVVPIIGLLLGVLPAAVLLGADAVGLGPLLAAGLAVATATVTTGAFHEDGLADTADSFGAHTTERRLEVMRDSRIGTFGAAALILGLLLRVGALAELIAHLDAAETAALLVAAAGASRAAPLLMMVLLPTARTDGASYSVGLPSRLGVGIAWVLAAATGLALAAATGAPLGATAAGLGAVAIMGLLAVPFAARHIGGYTGDIAGAAQQVSEIAMPLTVLAVVNG